MSDKLSSGHPTYGMYTAPGAGLVQAFIERACQRDWPLGTTIEEATEWVQEQVETAGKDIRSPFLYDPPEEAEMMTGADEVSDTDCREQIAYALEQRMTEK